jgi:thioredoxin reductase
MSDTPVQRIDVLVVGGGPAGLSAALVLSQAGRAVTVIDDNRPRNTAARHVRGYLTRDGVPPSDLIGLARTEVERFGATILDDKVVRLCPAGNGRPLFAVETRAGARLTARRVALATGVEDRIPNVPGLAELWGSAAGNCPYCHGWDARGKQIIVLGGTAPAARLAILLTQWSPNVTLLPLGNGFDLIDEHRAYLDKAGVWCHDAAVRRLMHAGGKLESVELVDNTRLPGDVCFVPTTGAPRVQLLANLWPGRWPPAEPLRLDPTGRTEIPGCWLIGNVANPHHHMIRAAADGATAAQAINQNMLEEHILDEPDRRQGIRPHQLADAHGDETTPIAGGAASTPTVD